MKNFLKVNNIVGINFGLNDLSLMSFTNSGKKSKITAHSAIKLDSERARSSLENSDGYLEEQISNLINKAHGKINSKYCFVAVPSIKTFSKTLQIPSDSRKEINNVIDMEIEQYIPIPKDLLEFSYQEINQVEDNINILLNAIPKSIVNRVIEVTNSVGLEPILIEPSMNSIARLLINYEGANLNTLIIDIGIDYTDIAILDKAIRITNSVAIGGNNFTQEIARELNITLEKAHQLKILKGFTKSPQQAEITRALENSLKVIIKEIKKLIRYNENRLSGREIEQVLVMGISSNVAGLSEWLTNELMMPVRPTNPWRSFVFSKEAKPKKSTISRYLTVAGMAGLNPKEVIND